jgi:hypothetical protein
MAIDWHGSRVNPYLFSNGAKAMTSIYLKFHVNEKTGSSATIFFQQTKMKFLGGRLHKTWPGVHLRSMMKKKTLR